jgi:ariadne-1
MDHPSSQLAAAGITVPEPTSTATRTRSSDSTAASTNPTSNSSRRSTRGASRLLTSLSGGNKVKSPVTSPTLTHYTPRSFKPKSSDPSEPFVCPICFDDSPGLRTVSLDCEHTFCSNCWTAYLISKIRDESEHSVKCMAEGCALVCPDPFIRTIIGPGAATAAGEPGQEEDNAKAWSHFQELLVRHYVASNKRLKFCPYPGCTNTVSCPSAADKSSLTTIVPTVSCGARGIGDQMTQSQSQSASGGLGLQGKEHKFCFGCTVEADHGPVICAVARMWLRKCRDDSETANWIKSNTKECSQCQSTIEKNGGCKCVFHPSLLLVAFSDMTWLVITAT